MNTKILMESVASDLPKSKATGLTILTQRVVEQAVLGNLYENSPLVQVVRQNMLRNGIKDYIYRDVRPGMNSGKKLGESISSNSDVVEIYKAEPKNIFQETVQCNSFYNDKFTIFNSVLNDTFIDQSKFDTLFNEIN
jgi:hypothetical protein